MPVDDRLTQELWPSPRFSAHISRTRDTIVLTIRPCDEEASVDTQNPWLPENSVPAKPRRGFVRVPMLLEPSTILHSLECNRVGSVQNGNHEVLLNTILDWLFLVFENLDAIEIMHPLINALIAHCNDGLELRAACGLVATRLSPRVTHYNLPIEIRRHQGGTWIAVVHKSQRWKDFKGILVGKPLHGGWHAPYDGSKLITFNWYGQPHQSREFVEHVARDIVAKLPRQEDVLMSVLKEMGLTNSKPKRGRSRCSR